MDDDIDDDDDNNNNDYSTLLPMHKHLMQIMGTFDSLEIHILYI